ncbi:MAG: hypothetical protein AAF439_10420, partial [Pseudomonadota bacterium]
MTWRLIVSIAGALLVFGVLAGGMRLLNWVPVLLAVTAGLGIRAALGFPGKDRKPEGDPYPAIAELSHAANRLITLSKDGPRADEPLFCHLGNLVRAVRDHHIANPDHTERTRRFRKHVLPRMISSIEDYITLAQRAGADQQGRLAEVSRQFEAYVPVLEKIDRACLDNDLT